MLIEDISDFLQRRPEGAAWLRAWNGTDSARWSEPDAAVPADVDRQIQTMLQSGERVRLAWMDGAGKQMAGSRSWAPARSGPMPILEAVASSPPATVLPASAAAMPVQGGDPSVSPGMLGQMVLRMMERDHQRDQLLVELARQNAAQSQATIATLVATMSSMAGSLSSTNQWAIQGHSTIAKEAMGLQLDAARERAAAIVDVAKLRAEHTTAENAGGETDTGTLLLTAMEGRAGDLLEKLVTAKTSPPDLRGLLKAMAGGKTEGLARILKEEPSLFGQIVKALPADVRESVISAFLAG